MIHWEPPGYSVVFSTREGGVSEGPYASLNLGRMTGDDVDRVDENRRLLCAAIGADAERLALNRQVHSTLVHRAEPGARGEPGDGLWTDDPEPADPRDDGGLPADRARAQRRRAGGRRPARGLARAARRHRPRSAPKRLGGGPLQAAVGPAIGPCCYEVGEEVSDPSPRRSGPTSSAAASSTSGAPPSGH